MDLLTFDGIVTQLFIKDGWKRELLRCPLGIEISTGRMFFVSSADEEEAERQAMRRAIHTSSVLMGQAVCPNQLYGQEQLIWAASTR